MFIVIVLHQCFWTLDKIDLNGVSGNITGAAEEL